MCFGGHKYPFLLGIHLGVELLGHRVQRCLISADPAREFSTALVGGPSLLIRLIRAGEMFYLVLGGLQRFSLCQAVEFEM